MVKRFPRYISDSDYTTNAPSYYDDLARKQKLFEILSKRIWEYDETLNNSLDNIEKAMDRVLNKIDEGFNDEVQELLVKWVDDGTLNHIINTEIMNTKADRITVNDYYSILSKKIESLASGSPKGTFKTLAELKQTFPNGDENIYVITDNGHWYYWNDIDWESGGVYQSTNLDDSLNEIVEKKINRPLTNKVKNGDFSKGTKDWRTQRVVSFETHINEAIFLADRQYGRIESDIDLVYGHQYYAHAYVEGTTSNYISLDDKNLYKTKNGYEKLSFIMTSNVTKTGSFSIGDGGTSIWVPTKAKKAMVVDLTATFGKGKEPTLEEFEEFLVEYGGWIDGTISLLYGQYNLLKQEVDEHQKTTFYHGNINSYPEFHTLTRKLIFPYHTMDSGLLIGGQLRRITNVAGRKDYEIDIPTIEEVGSTLTRIIFSKKNYGIRIVAFNEVYDHEEYVTIGTIRLGIRGEIVPHMDFPYYLDGQLFGSRIGSGAGGGGNSGGSGETIVDMRDFTINGDYSITHNEIILENNSSAKLEFTMNARTFIEIEFTSNGRGIAIFGIGNNNSLNLINEKQKPFKIRLYNHSYRPNASIEFKTADSNLHIKNVRITFKNSLERNEHNDSVKFIAHRGLSMYAPENTLPAFSLAQKFGMWAVECDIYQTKDGVWVLIHDNVIDRVSNGTGRVEEFTYQELLQYDFGGWFGHEYKDTKIPTLDEFILFCKQAGLHAFVELKGAVNSTNVVDIFEPIYKYGMSENVTILIATMSKLNTVTKYDKKIRIAYSSQITPQIIETMNSYNNEIVFSSGFDYMGVEDVAEQVRLAHDNGYKVYAWTINDLDEYRKLIADGVDGITTDSLNLSGCYL